jgi:hypothetical protein
MELKIGQELLRLKAYLEALRSFNSALALEPGNKEARLYAGWAAYWLRKPTEALGYWSVLLDGAKRNSEEEWELECGRVLALSALDQEAAEQVVARLYEMRREGKPKIAAEAQGFLREHLYAGRLRAACWEVFDERHDAPHPWTFNVTMEKSNEDVTVRALAVRTAALPGGGKGYALTEEGADYHCVYKYWPACPEYQEVHELVLKALSNSIRPLERSAAANTGHFAREAEPIKQPLPQERTFSDKEQALAARIESFGLGPEPTRMLKIVSRLRENSFDVSNYARLSLVNPKQADELLAQLTQKAPFVQEDAYTLADLITQAKQDSLVAVWMALPRLGERSAYLDFALAMGLSTRSQKIPADFLQPLLESSDFMARQTAALLKARQGGKEGLELLFKDLGRADWAFSSLLNISLEDLVGKALGMFPPDPKDETALQAWQKGALDWWKQNGASLRFAAKSKTGQAYWRVLEGE